MTRTALGMLEGEIAIEAGEVQIQAILEELRAGATEWVLAVLPAVVADAEAEVSSNHGEPLRDDSVEQAAAMARPRSAS